ncbi:MAG: hypothetical protein MUC47_07130 [Candidatus Kapabacteria bacterium]|jgi:hypothetical protein|nr:hypothetical protein [Candidatus Kapabacteria bacterium]
MPRVLFRVSYAIPDGKRADYLALVEKLRRHYAGSDVQYAVFADQHRHNHFQEVTIYPTVEAYEASDDPATIGEAASAVIEQIATLALDVQYSVATEV